MDISIRQATITDIPEITTLYRYTILEVNAKDYNEKQVSLWASVANDTELWSTRIQELYFIVAEMNSNIVGFAYLKKGCYLDGLFVHKDYQRQGIASALVSTIESQVMIEDFPEIQSDISKTALPFFEDREYEIVKKRKKDFKGTAFLNYIVKKQLF